jgi:hypothetical protein
MRAAIILLLVAASARAQLPHARLDRIFPLGGSPGASVDLTVEGRDLDGLTGLRFDAPGFKATPLKGNAFRVTIPADAAPGVVEVRAVGKHGITCPRLFMVGKGLTDVMEKEPNDTPATAQKVPLDCAIHGRSDGEGDDYFRFTGKKGQRVVLECQALRLDSTMRPALILSDAAGKELARGRPYFHRTDPLIDVVLPADGDFVAHVHDMTYAGGLPYRLVISTRPHVEAVFPPAVNPGEKRTLTLLGRNLPGGKPSPGEKLLDLPLDELSLPFTASKKGGLSFRWHPPSPSALTRGEQILLSETTLLPVTVLHADHPVIEEKEPNDTAATAQPIKLPCWVCGRLQKPGDADWYRFDLNAGETVSVEAFGERLERPGDLFLLITDDKGNDLAQLDDHGPSVNALALFNRDPSGTFTAPRKGSYRVLVQDRYRQGGPRHTYALRIAKPEPDMHPVAFHSTNPHPTCPLVRAGGSDHLEVYLNRQHFNGPAVIEVKGLPPGVSCPPVHVSAQGQHASVVFTAAEDAKGWEGPITLTVTAEAAGKKITRPVTFVQRRWAIDNISTSRVCREVCVAVRQGAPYGVRLAEASKGVQGGTATLRATVRRSAGFKGKVQLTGLNLPPGFSLATAEIPEGKDAAEARLKIQPNVPAGAYTIVLQGDAQVPVDKKTVRVASPTAPVTITVEAMPKKK